MHGQGILEDFLNKTKYIGQFKDGQKDGEGIFKISDQQEIEGTFRNDQPSGKCKERICQVVVENLKKNLIETLEEGEYNNGIKTGVFSSITTSNDLIIQKTKYYENGQLIYEEEDDS
ncbi:unnamed protein product [Paramecium sonneborni]|uniref:MORN repeat protein n=1 Tax=Paramecium sonneborni TaxID=65129 RepID=A0A8S1RDZ6_9CILI|nr:unnamed protein product [Paramecium sonneborni]